MLIAQITDCHIVEPGALLFGRVDTAASLRAALGRIEDMRPRPDVVIATGDLVNDGRPEQYRNLAGLLGELTVPVVVSPGNHDDRDELRALFPTLPPGGPDDPLDHVVDGFAVRLVSLDTTVPGSHGGHLTPDQLAWLDLVLGSEPTRPTLLCQHHPPFRTGIAWMDEVGLDDPTEEAAVVERHRNVVAVTSGHVHRPISTRFAGTIASCWPSTGAQVALALDGTPYGYVDEPPAIVLHRWDPAGGLTSHLCYVDQPPTWLPDWAPQPDTDRVV